MLWFVLHLFVHSWLLSGEDPQDCLLLLVDGWFLSRWDPQKYLLIFRKWEKTQVLSQQAGSSSDKTMSSTLGTCVYLQDESLINRSAPMFMHVVKRAEVQSAGVGRKELEDLLLTDRGSKRICGQSIF